MTIINRKRGDTYADEVIIKSVSTGLPVDISGCTFLLTLDTSREPTSSASNVYQLPGAILDNVGGRVGFAPSALQANRVGVFYYDIQMTGADGRIRTVALDAYIYTQDLTK